MKRKNGEGSWGKKKIKGVEYRYFRNTNGKYFYGKTEKEIKEKIKKYEKENTVSTSKLLLSDFMKDWLYNTKQHQVKRRTFDSYEQYYNMLIINYKDYIISDVQLCSLTTEILTKYFNSLADKYSLSTIKKANVLLNQCLNYAVDKELIDVNPMDKVKLPNEDRIKKQKKQIPFLSPDDMDKLYEESFRIQEEGFRINGAVGELVYGNNAKIIVLIMYTGLRISEALGLKWEDVDFENKCIKVKRNLSRIKNRDKDTGGKNYKYVETTVKKKASERTIPLSDRAYEVLEYLKTNNKITNDTDYVCVSKNGKIAGQRNITRTLNSMLVRGKCSVKKCGLHSLRHSFGSFLVSKGVDIATVSTLMGHEDITTTYNVYTHVLKQQQIDAIKVFDNK